MALKFLVSAGPTREYIDPVRFLSNPSSGKMGFAVAKEAVRRGYECVLVSGPVNLRPPKGCRFIPVISAEDMYQALKKEFRSCDVLIMTAAVSDFKPARMLKQKEHKIAEKSTLELVRTKDILKSLSPDKGKRIVIGFAAETNDLEASGKRKLFVKGLDMIVANDVSKPLAGFAVGKLNATFLYPKKAKERLGLISKVSVARKLIDFAEKEAKNK
ncbi:phosphopantothenoylcysteine decarboxylase [bacterium]|nr:phosphopantothenoylcysteine decarboxylase [bacterium]